jgi:hypothetical protein
VTGNQVADHSLTAVDVAPDSLTGAELGTGTVGATELAADSVLNKSIKDGAVTKTKLGKDAVAESEVRDGSLTAKDVGEVSDSFAATVGSVAADTCKTQDFGAQPVDVTGAIVLVGAPVDGVVATARPIDAATLRLQVCNQTTSAVVADGAYPFIAFAP